MAALGGRTQVPPSILTAAPDVVWRALTDAGALIARGLVTTTAAKVGHRLQ